METNRNNSFNVNLIITTFATLFGPVFTSLIPNNIFKILFLLCCLGSLIIFLNNAGQNIKMKKIASISFAVAALIILIISNFINNISFQDYLDRIASFHKAEKTEDIVQINENLNNLEIHFDSIVHDQSISRLCTSTEDPEEVEEILQKITKDLTERKDNFQNIKKEKNQLELYYKIFLTGLPYHYYNILKALESYGIDCKKNNITEYTLAVWDLQYLLLAYNMRVDLEKYDDNEYFDSFTFDLGEYKVKEVTAVNDSLDYNNWQYKNDGCTAKQLKEISTERYYNCYKKICLNFDIKK